MKAGADGIRPVSLELGGKNAAVVFADCDFDNAVEGTRSCFENAGQVCLGTERVYVERPIFDKFVAALKAHRRGMKPGRPFDPDTKIGPLVSKSTRRRCWPTTPRPRRRAPPSSPAAACPTCPTS
jgi:aminomuconate-semialdehyde/2-hydroxymuconate-6-semialdehyde dehydrogenase